MVKHHAEGILRGREQQGRKTAERKSHANKTTDQKRHQQADISDFIKACSHIVAKLMVY
jgi:hypothetical protein